MMPSGGGGRRRQPRVGHAAAGDHRHRGDFLQHAVFVDLEVFLLQVGYEIALVVANHHVGRHQIDLHAEGRLVLRGGPAPAAPDRRLRRQATAAIATAATRTAMAQKPRVCSFIRLNYTSSVGGGTGVICGRLRRPGRGTRLRRTGPAPATSTASPMAGLLLLHLRRSRHGRGLDRGGSSAADAPLRPPLLRRAASACRVPATICSPDSCSGLLPLRGWLIHRAAASLSGSARRGFFALQRLLLLQLRAPPASRAFSARRRSRQCSTSGGGIGVASRRGQSNRMPGFCASIVRRTSSVNGRRPTFTCGGVRNQNSTRWRDGLPRRGTPGSTMAKCSYPRLSRENLRNGTYFRFCAFAGFRALATGFVFFAAGFAALRRRPGGFRDGFAGRLAIGFFAGRAIARCVWPGFGPARARFPCCGGRA